MLEEPVGAVAGEFARRDGSDGLGHVGLRIIVGEELGGVQGVGEAVLDPCLQLGLHVYGAGHDDGVHACVDVAVGGCGLHQEDEVAALDHVAVLTVVSLAKGLEEYLSALLIKGDEELVEEALSTQEIHAGGVLWGEGYS